MSIKRVAMAAAAAILLLTGMLGATASAQQEPPPGKEARCKDNQTIATGKASILGEWKARRNATANWEREVRAKYGERYLDIAKSNDVSFECSQAGVGALGKLLTRCIVRATPCRHAVVQDDDSADSPDSAGDSGEDRRTFRIQQWLALTGYLESDQLDGEFGQETRRAVRRFQVDEDLPATGEVNDRTYRRLRERAADRS